MLLVAVPVYSSYMLDPSVDGKVSSANSFH